MASGRFCASIASGANQLHAVQSTLKNLPGLMADGVGIKPFPLQDSHLACFFACFLTALAAAFFFMGG